EHNNVLDLDLLAELLVGLVCVNRHTRNLIMKQLGPAVPPRDCRAAVRAPGNGYPQMPSPALSAVSCRRGEDVAVHRVRAPAGAGVGPLARYRRAGGVRTERCGVRPRAGGAQIAAGRAAR